MMDVVALVDEMRQGRLPDNWTPTAIMNVGDELLAMIDRVDEGDELRNDVMLAAETIAPACANMAPASALSSVMARFDTLQIQAAGLRANLIAFGALDADDDVTDPIALLGFLLPPA